jgi:ABC-2 type transport system permease protein
MNFRAMVWSVRREVWENRSIYIAPLIVAAIIIFGALIAALAGRNAAQHYDIAAGALMATTLIVAIFYCLDALYGERRDRSILFWKSMPVSDLNAVLSKMAIPLVILPIVTFVVTIATHLIMLLLSSAFLLMHGHSPAALWGLPWLQMSFGILYHLLSVHAIGYAPIFGWLLLVSAWAKRLPFLWAFLPPAAIGVVEKIVFNTSRFGNMIGSILSGGEMGGSMKGGGSMFVHFNPGEFLSRPGLWIGLVVAAICLAGAVRLRRYRDPI